MKLPIVILPTLLQIAAFAAIFHATATVSNPSLTRVQRMTEIRQLQQEHDQIEGKIAELKSRRGFLPRGVSYVADDEPAAVPLSHTETR